MRKAVAWMLGTVVCALAAISAVGFWATNHYDVSLRFLASNAALRSGLDWPVLDKFLQPSALYADRPLDGKVRERHPRILLPDLAQWSGDAVAPVMAERKLLRQSQGDGLDAFSPCGRNHVMSLVSCWLSTGDGDHARQAIARLLSSHPGIPAVENSGTNSWEWALAFDFLTLYPGLLSQEREVIATRMRSNLVAYLQLLDDESASLWHGRSSLAAQAWLLAVALDGEPGYDPALTHRAQGHFQQTVRALALTEAWPEGYNYWINSRALVIALAASAWVNGLEESQFAPAVTQALRRVGLWTVYATRPDNRIEPLGDEGPRVDLKDETRRVVDVITQLTGDSVFATYSSYLAKLHRQESYYRDYRWSFMLFNDPSVPTLAGVPAGDLTGLERYLPTSELFGAGALNLFISRTGWGADDTLIVARAGHTFTHHGHYDAGHFSIFKGAPLAIDSARYNGFFSPHRLYYGIRSIAANALLVVRPGDEYRPHTLLERSVNDGGQRLVMPTGSRVTDVDYWANNIGAGGHFEGGELSDYQVKAGHFAYFKADLTSAYDSTRFDSQGSGGKVAAVERELLYLFEEDRILVRDKVVATDASYRKKWIMHTINKPFVAGSKVLLGNEEAGVLESSSDSIIVSNGRGRLDVKRILPAAAAVRAVGGDGYQHWVESDSGFDGSISGENFSEGAEEKPWFDNGNWRLEILPRQQQLADEFLLALSPSLGRDRSREVSAVEAPFAVIATTDHMVVFTGGKRLGELSFSIPASQHVLLVSGVVAGDVFTLTLDDQSEKYQVARSGVWEMELPQAQINSKVILRQE